MYLTAENEWEARAPQHIKNVVAANPRNATQHGRPLFFQNRERDGYSLDLHSTELWRFASCDDHLELWEAADAAELYLRILQEVFISELPSVGVTLVTGRGIGAVLQEVEQRLELLKGSVVKSYQVWQPLRHLQHPGALQVTILLL